MPGFKSLLTIVYLVQNKEFSSQHESLSSLYCDYRGLQKTIRHLSFNRDRDKEVSGFLRGMLGEKMGDGKRNISYRA